MGKIAQRSKLLKEINNLEQNCSDTEYDESDLVGSTREYLPSNNESPSESSDTDSEDEVLRRLRRKSKNIQAFSNSESESDQDVEMSVIDQESEISVDGTMWKKLQEGSTPGRLPVHDIFKEMPGPTAYAKRHIMKARGTVDATQEMLTLALCNIFGSCFQSMPTSGAFTRSAVISASGVRTPFACLYSAAITLLALAFLGPYFHYIPRSTLAAVLIAAVIFLVDWEIVVPLYKSNRLDLLILIATLLGCLGLGIEIGMLIGVLISLMQLIYKWARPGITVESTRCSSGTYKIITPQNNLYFPSVDYISSFIMKNSCSFDGSVLPVLIDCSKINGSDYSTAKSMATLSKVFEKRGQQILLANVPENILKIWKSAGCTESQFCKSEQVENSLFGISIERKRISEDKTKYGDHNSEEIRDLVDKNNIK